MEEEHFLSLFMDVLDSLREKKGVSDDELNDSVENVRRSFLYGEGGRFQDIDYRQAANLCAYFYRNSPLSAGITRNKMLDALSNCPEFRGLFNKQEIKIVSVGGGSGSDIVGLYSALCEMDIRPHKIDLTVVDKFKGWRLFLNKIMSLLKQGSYGNASSLYQNCIANNSFVCEDLLTPHSREFWDALATADIVFMKSLLSIIPFSEKDIIAGNIIGPLKRGSLFVHLDSPEYAWEQFGLKKIYPLEPESNDENDINYYFPLTPRKLYGNGISRSSKAQISAFLK